MLGLIISVIVVGLIAGLLARLIVPGKQNLSIGMTIVIGIIGSFVGGFLGYLIFHHDSQNGFLQPSGIIGSIIGAIIAAASGADANPSGAEALHDGLTFTGVPGTGAPVTRSGGRSPSEAQQPAAPAAASDHTVAVLHPSVPP